MKLHPQDSLPTSPWIFLGTYFVTIATILGTGILGLPVELYRCGFWPFMFLFVPSFVAQACVVELIIEILAHTVVLLRRRASEQQSTEMGLLDVDETLASESGEEEETADEDEESVPQIGVSSLSKPLSDSPPADVDTTELEKQSIEEKANEQEAVEEPAGAIESEQESSTDLHTVATLFLPPWAVIAFNVFVLFHFSTILTSYGIAGAQALAQILGQDKASPFVPPFVISLSLLICLGQKHLTPVVSFLTFLKGTLLVLVVAITGLVAHEVAEDYRDDWRYIGDPFLISTVALGGAINTLPLFFQRVSFNSRDIRRFKWTVHAGLFTVWLLNFLWALFVLQIVPQASLERAHHEGKIATVPVSSIIRRDHSSWAWVGSVVQAFIAISVTVSFFAVGSGLKHFLDGWVEQARHSLRLRVLFKSTSTALLSQATLYTVSFGVILLIALTNPSAFLNILDNWTSLALNMESAVFVCWMVWVARHRPKSAQLPLDPPTRYLSFGYACFFVAAVYFSAAVLFDVINLLISVW